jgi:hypothetical protein
MLAGVVCLFLLWVGMTGCRKREPRPFLPPPLPPLQVYTPVYVEVADPPRISLAVTGTAWQPVIEIKPLPEWVDPPKPGRRQATTPPVTAPEEPAVGTPAPLPQLGRVLTPEEKRQYSESITASLNRAQNALQHISRRRLSASQRAEVARIRTFVREAETVRESDPVSAHVLAQRAEILSQTLLGALP